MTPFVTQADLTDESVRGIGVLAAALDWPCYVVDLRGCCDKPELLERIAAVLMLPSWFGHNWDALFDCMVDLASARRSTGCVLVLRHAVEMRTHAPEALDTALGILQDAAGVWQRRGVAMRTFVDVGIEAGRAP